LDSPPLVEVRRGPQIESLHRGAVAVVDRAGRIRHRAGPVELATYFRSAAKPLQTLPLVESGGVDALGLTDEELAVTCGSHAGEPAHLRAVRGILSKAGLDEGALRCGVHPPANSEIAAALIREGRQPSPLHNNCSGKHAGMLAACRHRGWPTESYLAPEHPLQREIAGIVAACCGLPAGVLPTGTDGCGVPTFYGSLRQLARAYAVLADPQDLPDRRAAAIGRVTGVMREHPFMIGGTGRLATEVQARLGDRLVCKGGAEALFGIGLLREGWGVAIKVEDGNARAMGPAVVDVLRQLGAIDPDEAEALAFLHHPVVRNHHGWDVGEMRPAFRLEKVS
jgi:L-asparaginase II